MKCVSGIILTLLVVFYQECGANNLCCKKFQYGGSYYQERLFKGKSRLSKGHLSGFDLTDGFNYNEYFAISTFNTHHFVLSDVCFYVKCASKVKVVTYDSHFKYLDTFHIHLDFADASHYYNDHYVCLSDPLYQAYFTYPFCLEHVRYVRIFAHDFHESSLNFNYNFNYNPTGDFAAGYNAYDGGIGGKLGGGGVGKLGVGGVGKLGVGSVGKLGVGGVGNLGGVKSGKFFAGSAAVKGGSWVPRGSRGVIGGQGGVIGLGGSYYYQDFNNGANYHYDQHYVNPSCPKGALIWDGHMTGCGAIQKKKFGSGRLGGFGSRIGGRGGSFQKW